MTEFQGFPAGGRVAYTSIPDMFFSALLPQITDLAELKVTLHIISLLYHKKGYPRFVSESELLGNPAVMEGIKGSGESPEAALRGALDKAVQRGSLLHLDIDREGIAEAIYFLNDSANRQAVERIRDGTLKPAGINAVKPVPAGAAPPPNIFKLYEDNIGMLTPMIADELRDAERLYPEDWIKDAIQQAVNQGKRKWSIIAAILERWSVEGKSDGTYQRDTEKTGPDKYFKGKYGHMVQH